MLLENIAPGKTLEIYVDRDGYRYRLVSKVEQTSVRRICVTAITANGRAFAFRPEDDIRLVYRDEEQMWEWLRVKAGIAKLDGELVHYFDIVNKGRSFNRRNAYRVRLDEEVQAGYYDMPDSRSKSALVPLIKEEYEAVVDGKGEEMETEDPEQNKTGKVIVEKRVRTIPMPDAVPHRVQVLINDISETGLGIYTNEIFKIEDGFFLGIPSPYGSLKVKASVVRADERPSANRKYKYYYGCIYTESDQKLSRYIFDIQRKQIQKQREKKQFEASRTRKTKNGSLEI